VKGAEEKAEAKGAAAKDEAEWDVAVTGPAEIADPVRKTGARSEAANAVKAAGRILAEAADLLTDPRISNSKS
jgi:hypothetical protein